jgi:hypothetical protein
MAATSVVVMVFEQLLFVFGQGRNGNEEAARDKKNAD